MPELRIDPTSGRQVLFAQERALRPQELLGTSPLSESDARRAACPFCAGHEAATPPAVDQRCDPNGAWRVRVVPNKFPAIVPPAGRHEVVIESPAHLTEAAALDVQALRQVLLVYRDRLAVHLQADGVVYATVFKNSGAEAGASLEHVHSQVISLPATPLELQRELDLAEQYLAAQGRCLFCELVAAEIQEGARMVIEGEHVVAFTAAAGRQPYETWLAPRRHHARYEQLDEMVAQDLAAVLQEVLQRRQAVAPQGAYNLVLHTAPKSHAWDAAYHWHWELIPRMSRAAGLELGSGVYINTLLPEAAAEQLRAAMIA